MSPDTVYIITTSFDHLALALISALAVAALWLMPPSSRREEIRRTWLLSAVLMIAFVTASGELLIRTAALADVVLFQAWPFIPKVLNHSDYGFYWSWRMVAWGAMVVMAIRIWRRDWSRFTSVLLLITAITITLLQSVTSHAGEAGLWSLANIMNWIHLASTALWGGMVILYAFLFLPSLRDHAASVQVSSASERLSTMASVALALVLASGLYNTWHQITMLSDLWLTDYGRVLLVKLMFVTFMMLIGALNRFLWVPQLVAWQQTNSNRWGPPANRFLGVLRFDSFVFVAILISAVVLGTESPPVHGVG